MMEIKRLNPLSVLFNRIHQTLNEKQFLILSSIIVGISAGLAAVILKLFVHSIRRFLLEDYLMQTGLLYAVFPALGLAVVVFLIKPVFKGDTKAGNVGILHSIAKKGSFLPFEQVYSYIITSGITVGFGGSAGLESPIVNTGSAIGSNFSRFNRLSYKERTLLLSAGAAGGIAGAFNAPIAGMLFALEVILVDISITAFIPLLIASVSGALMSAIILNEGVLLSFQTLRPFDYHNIPFYILLSILAGFTSVYFVNMIQRIESFFSRFKSRIWRWLAGSLILLLLLNFFPALFGEGYESIKLLAKNDPQETFSQGLLQNALSADWLLLLMLVLVLFFKVFATAATIGCGGVGGNFAPSLFLGAYLGFCFALFFRFIGINLPYSNFTLVAMAGILSGVFHAPLTAIFLIAEISGGYTLIIPLMIVASVSFLIVKIFHPESMDIKNLRKKGTVISGNKDESILARIELHDLIETDFGVLHPENSLREVIEQIKQNKRNVFPVVAENNQLIGIIQLESIRKQVFEPGLYDKVKANEIMEKPASKVSSNDSIFAVMKKFDESGQSTLPVHKDGEYLGFLSKSALLSKYRNELIDSFN
jgi:CIC family chloride channel protein